MEKTYFAIFSFSDTDKAFNVRFPDVPGAITCGVTLEDAAESAVDALSAILSIGRKGKDYSAPASYSEILEHSFDGDFVFPVVASKVAMEEYKPKKRINIMVPVGDLEKIDNFVKSSGADRSSFLCQAAMEKLSAVS